MKRPFFVVILILIGIFLSGLSDTVISVADTANPSNEIAGSVSKANNSSANATITITMYAVGDELPHSMKGYELYSWSENGQWHFTLITGTNRNKMLEEIISREDVISETGWVRVQVIGVNAIKAVLSKLHQGEEIVWLARPRSDQTPPDDTDFMFPPEQIIDSIKEHAEQSDLDLLVQALS